MDKPGLWSVAASYFQRWARGAAVMAPRDGWRCSRLNPISLPRSCGESGMDQLTLALEQTAIQSDVKARKVLHLCSKLELPETGTRRRAAPCCRRAFLA